MSDDKASEKPEWLRPSTVLQMLILPLSLLILSQIFTTVLPIWLGTIDFSDFGISIEPPGQDFHNYYKSISANVTVEDLHYLAPYRHTIYLYAKMPNESNLSYRFDYEDLKDCRKPPFNCTMVIWPVEKNRTKVDQPIEIIGIGGDGKKRSCFFMLKVDPKNSTSNSGLVSSHTSPGMTTRVGGKKSSS